MTRPVPAGPPGRGRLPVQARDRRPALAALALLLVLVGALGAALVVYRSGRRVDVLIAAREIRPGDRVTSADFTTARVSSDGGETIPVSAEPRFIGSYATVDIPRSTFLNATMFLDSVLPADSVIVGVTVSQQNRPAQAVESGDAVQVYIVPNGSSSTGGQSGGPSTAPTPTAEQAPVTGLASGQLLIQAARVVGVATPSATSSSGTLTVSLLVTTDIAPQLTYYESLNQIALGSLPPGTKVSPDLDVNDS